jgi:hypothetical protein
MNYRIIAETEASGTKWYYVQKRYLSYFWCYVREVRDITMYKYKIGFKSIEEANLYIQADVNSEYAESQKKIVKRERI